MSAPQTSPYGFRYIGAKRRTKEHPRFVTGRGRYAADIALPGLKHVALVASPHASAKILSIYTEAARAAPGVHYVLTGEEFCAATDSLPIGVDAPKVTRWALARERVRYAGEWVAAVVADTRALAEDAAELIEVEYEPLPHVTDAEQAIADTNVLVHPAHGSNVILHRNFVWGPVEDEFAKAEHQLSFRATWNRNATVPIETFAVAAQWNPATEILDIWASIQMPKYPDQAARALRLPGNAVRVHYDVDVGGSYGVKRGIKHTVLVGYLAKRLGMPVRLIEDRLENMRGGDMHGPDRTFDMTAAFDGDGTIRALKIRAIDNVGAYAGRAPFQLGKPVSAICGPYAVKAVAYEPVSVMTNKTPQEAVRGFGQAPTNFALERTMDRVARHLNMDRLALRQKNLIRKDQFPYTIPSGSTYDSGDYQTVLDKALAAIDYPALVKQRDAARQARPARGHRHLDMPGAERRQLRVRAAAQSEERDHDLDGFVPGAHRPLGRDHRHHGHVVIGPGPRDAGVDGDRRGPGARPGDHPRDPRRLAPGPALEQPGRQPHGDHAGRRRRRRGAPDQGDAARDRRAQFRMREGRPRLPRRQRQREGRAGQGPELGPAGRDRAPQIPRDAGRRRARAAGEIRLGGADRRRPADAGRTHPDLSLLRLRVPHRLYRDRSRHRRSPTIKQYVCGHDCGVMINPDIVHGMTYGGIAHGIGAALYEHFTYDDNGQLTSGTFMDYLIPSAFEIPPVKIVDHCTPSPLTTFGQKGSGEAGYLGAPAAVANAINDALAPLDVEVNTLPISHLALWETIEKAKR